MEREKAEIIKDVIDTFDKIELLERSRIVLIESEKRLANEKTRVKSAIENGLATPFEREKIGINTKIIFLNQSNNRPIKQSH